MKKNRLMRDPQTFLIGPTNRAPGKPAGTSVEGRAEAVRQPMVSDLSSLNVPYFDVFCPGHPRPFVSVHNFGPGGFKWTVPPVVTGRGLK